MSDNRCDKHAWKGGFPCPGCEAERNRKNPPMPAIPPSGPVVTPRIQSGYESLAGVLQAALDQSQSGKGKERHATGDTPFLQQPICTIGRMTGIGYNVGQAMKKGQEAMRLPTERAQAELLGAIVYLASAYLLLGERDGCNPR